MMYKHYKGQGVVYMEVKDIFVDNIMRVYRNSITSRDYMVGKEKVSDTITISRGGSRRLFEEIMEDRLKQSLKEAKQDENK